MDRGPGVLGGLALAALLACVGYVAKHAGAPAWTVRRGTDSVAVPRSVGHETTPPSATVPVGAPGSIRGAVVHGENDLPASGRTVTLTRDGAPPRTATTDAWGRFAFDDVPSREPHALAVAEAECGECRVAGIALLPGESRDAGTFRLDAPAEIRVVVTDESGAPVADAVVDLFAAPRGRLSDFDATGGVPSSEVPAWTGVTGAEGHAYFKVEARRDFTVAVSAPGWARVARARVGCRPGRRREAEFVLVRPAVFGGRVVDETGRAVARSVVFARVEPEVLDEHHGTWASGPGLWQRADADADGRFTFVALAPGDVEVAAAPHGGHPVPVARVRLPAVTDALIVHPATGSVEGRITDAESGAPVPGVTLAIRTSRAPSDRRAVTDADGRYTLPDLIPYDDVDLEIAPPPGWVSGPSPSFDVVAGDVRRADVTMTRAAVIEGRVTRDGAPVEGAMVDVLCVPDDVAKSRFWSDGRSDADGRFRIDDVPPGRVAVCATAPREDDGEVRMAFRAAVVGDAAARATHVFEAASASVVVRDVVAGRTKPDERFKQRAAIELAADRILGSKRVTFTCRVATADGAPLRSARIRIERGEPSRAPWLLRWMRAVPPDGTYVEVERAPEEDTVFHVVATDVDHDVAYVEDILVAASATEVAVDVVLPPLAVLRCRTLRDGEPVAGADIYRGTLLVARSGPDGTFTLSDRSGEYDVAVTAAGCVPEVFNEVEIPQDDVLDLHLSPALAIEGVVVGFDGAPVPGVRVTPVDSDGGVVPPYEDWPATAAPRLPVTGPDGRFRIAPLAAGDVRLRLDATPGTASGVATATSGPVEVGRTDVRVVARRANRLAGRLVDPERKGVAGARVLCAGEDDVTGAEDSRYATTDDDGAFAFEGLIDGDYRIDVVPRTRDELAPARWRMPAGRGDLALVAERAGILAGVVVSPDGRPVERAHLEATRLTEPIPDVPYWPERRLEGRTDADGRFRLVVPPGGLYRIEFGWWGDIAQRAVLRGGDSVVTGSTDLRLVAFEGLAIGGFVANEAGNRVFDADIAVRDARGVVRSVRANGGYRIPGLEGGVYDVTAHGPGRVPQIRRGVRAGTDDVRFVLVVGDSITGTLLDADGAPAKGWRIRALRPSDPETDLWRGDVRRDGQFSVAGIDEGEWVLDAVVEKDGVVVRSVPLGTFPWKSRDLALRLPR